MRKTQEIKFTDLYNWSLQYIISNDECGIPNYATIKLGDVLRRNIVQVPVENTKEYARVRLSWFGKGAYIRDIVYGSKIRTKTQYRIRKGQLLISKIDARMGAVDVVPEELDNAVVTSNFWIYDVDKSLAIPEFILSFLKTSIFTEFAEKASNGSTGRHYLQESLFLNMSIPLPSLQEQRSIVNNVRRMERSIHTKSQYITRLKTDLENDIMNMLGIDLNVLESNSDKCFSSEITFSSMNDWDVVRHMLTHKIESCKYQSLSIGDILSDIRYLKRGKSPRYADGGLKKIVNQKCIRERSIDISHAKKGDISWLNTLSSECYTQKGDILINSTGEGTLGRAGIVTSGCIGMVPDSHIITLRLNTNQVDPEYFCYMLNTRLCQSQINFVKTARSTSQTELGVQNLLKVVMPFPSLDVQKNISGIIRKTDSEIAKIQSKSKHYSSIVEYIEKKLYKSSEI